MAAETLTPAILDYVNHNTYPESEKIASSTLEPATLSTLLSELRKSQEEGKNDIRSLSKTTAPDIDQWISKAKELQADILRSRETARQIVQEAEAGDALKAEVEDQSKKIGFLEKEVNFSETLVGTLEHVQYANGLLEKVQDEAVRGDVSKALQRLEDAEASIAGLEDVSGSRAVEVLHERLRDLKQGLEETGKEFWDGFLVVNAEEKKFSIQEPLGAYIEGAVVPEISLEAIVMGVKGFGIFDELVKKLSKDLDRAILRPRMVVDEDGQVAKVSVSEDTLSSAGKSNDLSSDALFMDLHTILDFLHTRLPLEVTLPLSAHLIPALTHRLETLWLEPAIPVSISEMPAFQSLLSSVSDLVDLVESFAWNGGVGLRDWVDNAPRAWLTKRREVMLGEVRDLVFRGLRERKVVERVETRMMSKQDVGIAGTGHEESTQHGGGDDWDEAWDDPEGTETAPASQTSRDQQDDDEEEDASAWDMDDDDPFAEKKETTSTHEGEDDDAWGWNDDETTPAIAQKPPSSVASRKQQQQPQPPNGTAASSSSNEQQELTLRETFTVTAIPSGILTIIQQTISDAETLSHSTSFTNSPLAPAATALYTLPTLALAIYRATAPTAYTKTPDGVGNMLIYNDAAHLSHQLRKWQNSRPAPSRLKADNDLAALETFAKSAYTSEMHAQRTILRDLLDGAQGFGGCAAQPFKRECEAAVEGAVDRVRDVCALWKGLLSQGALLQSVGLLVAEVTGGMMREIQDLPDISEEDSLQLKALCERVGTLRSLFTTTTSLPNAERENPDLTLSIYVPTWLKFQYLPAILAASLADIRWMWDQGGLSLEFGVEEVVGLVEALFAESELRRGAVREIRADVGRGRG